MGDVALGRGLAVGAGDGHHRRVRPGPGGHAASSTKWVASRRSTGAVIRQATSTRSGHGHRGQGGDRGGRSQRPRRRPPATSSVPAHTRARVRRRRVQASGEVRPRNERPTGPAATPTAAASPASGHRTESHETGHGDDGQGTGWRGDRATSGRRTGMPIRAGSAPAGPPATNGCRTGPQASDAGGHRQPGHAVVEPGRPQESRHVGGPAGSRPRMTSASARGASVGVRWPTPGRVTRPGRGEQGSGPHRHLQRDLGVAVAPHQVHRAAAWPPSARRTARPAAVTKTPRITPRAAR